MRQRTAASARLYLNALGQSIRIDCSDPGLNGLLRLNFGAMTAPDSYAQPDVEYAVSISAESGEISLLRGARAALRAPSPGELLFLLEKDLTVELQRRRRDYYFLHSAAIDWNGGGYLLAAESGGGKSTTTWGLLHHGFRYLSDELSAIDLEAMLVHPYPHALCLKQLPPPGYALPSTAVDLGRTLHIPANALPGAWVSTPRPLRGVFIVKHSRESHAPFLHAIGAAEAAARLYVCALNALAHENHGLNGSVRIAERVTCFAVSTGDLTRTCKLIGATIQDIDAETRRDEAPSPI